MKILMTGFDPFGNSTVNPAYEAVKRLPDQIKGNEIIKLEIPTVFYKEGRILEEAVRIHNPDVVICVGQAGGREAVTVEKVAINLIEAGIPDNEGNQPFDKKVCEDGPTAYFASVPVKAMVKNIEDHGIRAKVSYTAGTYVCNDVMYRLLYMIDKKYHKMQGGFIHVPYLPEQILDLPKGTPNMDADKIAKALEYALEAIIEKKNEKNIVMGETH